MESPQTRKFILLLIFFFSFSVQDFLDKAKKDFEEKWAKNPKVSAATRFSRYCITLLKIVIEIRRMYAYAYN